MLQVKSTPLAEAISFDEASRQWREALWTRMSGMRFQGLEVSPYARGGRGCGCITARGGGTGDGARFGETRDGIADAGERAYVPGEGSQKIGVDSSFGVDGEGEADAGEPNGRDAGFAAAGKGAPADAGGVDTKPGRTVLADDVPDFQVQGFGGADATVDAQGNSREGGKI